MSMLLSKAYDRSYSHIVVALLVSSDDYEECMQRLLDKHNMINNNKDKGNNGSRNANNINSNHGNNRNRNRNRNPKSSNNNAGSNNNNGARNNNNNQNSSRNLNEAWKRISKEKRMHFIERLYMILSQKPGKILTMVVNIQVTTLNLRLSLAQTLLEPSRMLLSLFKGFLHPKNPLVPQNLQVWKNQLPL